MWLVTTDTVLTSNSPLPSLILKKKNCFNADCLDILLTQLEIKLLLKMEFPEVKATVYICRRPNVIHFEQVKKKTLMANEVENKASHLYGFNWNQWRHQNTCQCALLCNVKCIKNTTQHKLIRFLFFVPPNAKCIGLNMLQKKAKRCECALPMPPATEPISAFTYRKFKW